jgi:ATP synthase protein I
MATNDDDDEALKARLDKLAGQLKTVRPKPAPAAPTAPGGASAASAWSLGMKAASEFVASVAVGVAIGWGLDRLLHTRPAFTILFFLLGVAAGVWGVIRATTPKKRE